VTRRHDTIHAGRVIGTASLALGLVMVARPARVSQMVSGPRPVSDGWVRLLGARYLVQGAVQLARPRPAVMAGSVVVDGLHGLSMFALAAVRSDYRRPALVSAVAASAGATADALTARHEPTR
jgi:hypothetical protein